MLLARSASLDHASALALLRRFGLPQDILSASVAELARVIGDQRAAQFKAPPSAALQHIICRTQSWAKHAQRAVLTLSDANYPAALFHTAAPPLVLFTDGDTQRLQRQRLALVAPQQASAAARTTAAGFARALAQAGVALQVQFGSPFAKAVIDAAYAVPGADLVALLDAGPDRISPAAHLQLARRIANEGCLVSEHAPGESLARPAQRLRGP